MCSCAMQKTSMNENQSLVQLDFRNCAERNAFDYINLNLADGYQTTKVQNQGFCEYQFIYKDESILYVSTNTFSGSRLNYKNRLNASIKTYSQNRSENDTIRNSGVEEDGEYWLEWINGSYVVGYVNASDSTVFDKVIESISLRNRLDSSQE